MPRKINAPTLIKAEGTKLKIIEEFIGRVNTGTSDLSIAKMKSPQGWEEPGQQPAFDEYTIVLKGTLLVETRTEEIYVSQGQAIITYKDEWVRYSSPLEGGAEYIAVCLPAFSPDSVNRDMEG
jgi:mannose-6-phosphate isomerase-like protein (cupin superfamily)